MTIAGPKLAKHTFVMRLITVLHKFRLFKTYLSLTFHGQASLILASLALRQLLWISLLLIAHLRPLQLFNFFFPIMSTSLTSVCFYDLPLLKSKARKQFYATYCDFPSPTNPSKKFKIIFIVWSPN